MFQKGLRYSFCQLFFPNWWCNRKPKWLICGWVPNYPSSVRTSPEQSCPANLASLYCSCLCPHVTPGGEGGCRETKRGRNKRHDEERDAEERARKARQEAMCSRLPPSLLANQNQTAKWAHRPERRHFDHLHLPFINTTHYNSSAL